MADRLALLVIIALASLSAGCATQVPASGRVTHSLSDEETALRARVLAGADGRCADPATQRMSTAAWKAAKHWGPVHTRSAHYEAPALVSGAPTASYPEALLKAGTKGAVLVLLLISDGGEVNASRALCATDDAFVPAALALVRNNRYRPASLDGKPVPEVVFQPIVFGF